MTEMTETTPATARALPREPDGLAALILAAGPATGPVWQRLADEVGSFGEASDLWMAARLRADQVRRDAPARVLELQSRVDAALALHPRSERGACDRCGGSPYPCLTVQALRGDS